MKIFSNSCEFYYPWEQVTAANWRKYPNEMSTHVVAVDVLRRELDPTCKILTTERLITCKQSIPSWLLCMVGGKEVSYVREVSTVDMNTKTLTLRSINLTLNNLLKVYETVTYKPDQTDPFKTCFNQEAQITAYATFQRICNKIEDWSVERFGENAKKGKIGFDSVLKIFNEQWERRDELVDEISDKVVKTYDDLKIEIVKETDKILNEAEHVKKSILIEYYDIIKKAFKRDQ
ncbi:hypothetical protein WICANDRAFT_40009 [Wickerhamomyces anomalus NRRL Y-366-8]|uniref:PRELI/MSF1 domain-containing protein n=1 Tax=Wickerhamomyces anomalus (strain ATCC 58044 / CBS 1984 / NCYC 433 / NRRL Y-366-8) TaxID=683960 RepID=A0A1E3P594_WICAA|nr:uncharacterized protein WICANDRAFT_40009 [Wickerhamomyces anomalus NRRL Y-366-8]ODQ60639.1 hypothetical protein WICANDRAFT_40009 [Wickerhamomyces anomalus NRRL Y-366-8]